MHKTTDVLGEEERRGGCLGISPLSQLLPKTETIETQTIFNYILPQLAPRLPFNLVILGCPLNGPILNCHVYAFILCVYVLSAKNAIRVIITQLWGIKDKVELLLNES